MKKYEFNATNLIAKTFEELKDDKDELSMSDEQDDVVDASDTDCEEAADEDDDFMAFLSMLAGETSAEEVA